MPSDGPVLIISEKGVYPNNLDKIIEEQRRYYNMSAPNWDYHEPQINEIDPELQKDLPKFIYPNDRFNVAHQPYADESYADIIHKYAIYYNCEHIGGSSDIDEVNKIMQEHYEEEAE
jgi:hypothetical protein